jgi:uncharacterized protein (DUF4415 family)
MSKRIVTYELDLDRLPPLTQEERDELKALDQKRDDEIDLSDIPELDESFWNRAVQPGVYKPVKASTTVRVDADVLLWLRSKGKGYQTRINAILRAAMLREMGESGRG